MDASQPYVYPAVGHCIYCGPGVTEDLSKEHIVAESLGGKIVLPAASCDGCRKATSHVELLVLRGTLAAARYYLDIKSKKVRRGDREQGYASKTNKLNAIYEKVHLSNVSPTMLMPVIPVPGILRGVDPSDTLDPKYGVGVWGVDIGPYSAAGKANVNKPYKRTKTDIHYFPMMRMLAKIAHGYAVAERGVGSFQPYLTEAIRAGNSKVNGHHLPHYVGISRHWTQDILPSSLHHLGI